MTRLLWSDPQAFIRDNTRRQAPPLVPEIELHLADQMVPLWQLTEEEMSEIGLPPPYWAFAWAGGQAVARYVLDNPGLVAGRAVVDFAAGTGLVAIAAAKAGARLSCAVDIEALATAACRLNAAINDTRVEVETRDPIGADIVAEVVLAGDICYEKPLAGRAMPWLKRLAAEGVLVLLGDPGRAYLPREGLEKLATYEVQTTRELEDRDVRRTDVWRVVP